MRLLCCTHLFKRRDVRALRVAHLFERRDVRRLFLAHLFKTSNAVVSTAQLLPEHTDVGLATLCNATLTRQLSLHCIQMVQIYELLGIATSLVLGGNLGNGRGTVTGLGHLLLGGSLSALSGRGRLAELHVFGQGLIKLHSISECL